RQFEFQLRSNLVSRDGIQSKRRHDDLVRRDPVEFVGRNKRDDLPRHVVPQLGGHHESTSANEGDASIQKGGVEHVVRFFGGVFLWIGVGEFAGERNF